LMAGKAVRRLAAVAVLVALATVVATASGSNHATKFVNPPYKVGAVFALTGAYSGTDLNSFYALKATVAEINANGGVLKHKLVANAVDSQSDPAKSALAAQQVVDQFKPNVMIPDIVCIMALSALPVANKAGLVTFTGCDNGTPSNPALYPTNFSTFPPVAVQGVPLVALTNHVTKGKKVTIGFLHSNDAAGNGTVGYVKAAAIAKGNKWAGDQAFTVGTPDLTVQLSKLRSAGADFVILFGQAGDAGNTMKSVRDLGWNVQVLGNTGTTSVNLVNEVPADYRDNFHAMVTANSVRKKGSEALPEWIAKYLAKQTNTITTLSVVGAVHDGLTLWKWAAERAKTINPAKIRAQLEKLNTLPRAQWPKGLQLTANPNYSSTQHGERNANLNRAWGLISPTQNILGTWEGEVITCFCLNIPLP
jgi:branched-chain amino acid transport system substrate-binding protein